MPSINGLVDDYVRRQAAQAALLFPGIDPTEIVEFSIAHSPNLAPHITISLARPVNQPQMIRVRDAHPLVASEESVKDWTPGHADEYRRQFDGRTYTGSFHPPLPVHPDQVDLWMANPPKLEEAIGHRMCLNYTTDDDGVWLVCECGTSVSLSFSPSVSNVVAAMLAHIQEVSR